MTNELNLGGYSLRRLVDNEDLMAAYLNENNLPLEALGYYQTFMIAMVSGNMFQPHPEYYGDVPCGHSRECAKVKA